MGRPTQPAGHPVWGCGAPVAAGGRVRDEPGHRRRLQPGVEALAHTHQRHTHVSVRTTTDRHGTVFHSPIRRCVCRSGALGADSERYLRSFEEERKTAALVRTRADIHRRHTGHSVSSLSVLSTTAPRPSGTSAALCTSPIPSGSTSTSPNRSQMSCSKCPTPRHLRHPAATATAMATTCSHPSRRRGRGARGVAAGQGRCSTLLCVWDGCKWMCGRICRGDGPAGNG